MSLLSRYATRAVQRENVRLTKRITTLADHLRIANRSLEAASERNTQHIRNAVQAAGNALALGAAYDKLRAEYDRVADAHAFVTAERDQALADKVALEDQLTALAADNLDLAGHNADLEEQLAFRSNEADRANAALTNALNVPFVTAGQRYDLDDVRDEKRSMDRGDE